MITRVAIRFQGKIYSLPSPYRHHHIIPLIAEKTGVEFVDVDYDDEGFLDESGKYYNREQALAHALLNNQVKDPSKVRSGMLFSEDVW